MRFTFLSDVHARGAADPAQRALVHLLQAWDTQVFVLCGDVFDAWWGFDEAIPIEAAPVLAAMADARHRGARVVWLTGNRDFHAGRAVRSLGVEVSDTFTAESGGLRLLAAHGDRCDRRWGQRALTRIVRGPVIGEAAHLLGAERTWRAARRLADRSRARPADLDRVLADQRAWASRAAADGYGCVLLGHTHTRGVDSLDGGRLVRLGSFGDARDLTLVERGEVRQSHWG